MYSFSRCLHTPVAFLPSIVWILGKKVIILTIIYLAFRMGLVKLNFLDKKSSKTPIAGLFVFQRLTSFLSRLKW